MTQTEEHMFWSLILRTIQPTPKHYLVPCWWILRTLDPSTILAAPQLPGSITGSAETILLKVAPIKQNMSAHIQGLM